MMLAGAAAGAGDFAADVPSTATTGAGDFAAAVAQSLAATLQPAHGDLNMNACRNEPRTWQMHTERQASGLWPEQPHLAVLPACHLLSIVHQSHCKQRLQQRGWRWR